MVGNFLSAFLAWESGLLEFGGEIVLELEVH